MRPGERSAHFLAYFDRCISVRGIELSDLLVERRLVRLDLLHGLVRSLDLRIALLDLLRDLLTQYALDGL